MKIKFSRHAKRRAKLYKIPLTFIENILKNETLNPRENIIIKKLNGEKYPIKIVAVVENGEIIVVTNYPLKKKRGT